MNKAAIVVINEESKNQIEVLDASKLFNRHRSQSFTSRSFFDASEEKQRINSLIRQSGVYCSFDRSNYIQQYKTNTGEENRRVSRKRKLAGSLQCVYFN